MESIPSKDELVSTAEQKYQKQVASLSKRLKNLNPTWTQEQLETRAKEILVDRERIKEVDVNELFTDAEEQTQANDVIKKYLTDYSIETVSDRNLLSQLVYFEVLHKRLQKDLNDEKKLDNKQVIIELLHKNIKEISSLKDKLGISRNKTQEQKKDGFSYLQNIQRKYKKWLSENQASRYMVCPHCGLSILLKMKMEAWEALKHPWFKDRILANPHLVRLYMEKKLNKTDLAKIFGVSEDYCDWLVEKYNGVWKNELQGKLEQVSET